MPRLKIHDVLDAAARWAGGDRDAFDRAMREGEQQASARSSLRMHQSARRMGLESDSEDENFDTNRPRTYREKGKYGPPVDSSNLWSSDIAGGNVDSTPMSNNNDSEGQNFDTYEPGRNRGRRRSNTPADTSAPFGSVIYDRTGPSIVSTSGTTINYGATDGYQRDWQHTEGARTSRPDRLPDHITPQELVSSRYSSEYPSSTLGQTGRPWGQLYPPPHTNQGNYTSPYSNSEDPREESSQFSNRTPVETSTPYYTPLSGTPVNGSAYKSRMIPATNQQDPPYFSSAPITSRNMYDPVRDAVTRNSIASEIHSEPTSHSTTPATLIRRPVPTSNSRQSSATGGGRWIDVDDIDQSNMRHHSEQEHAARARMDRKSDQISGMTNQRPPPIPPKIPLSTNERQSSPIRSSTLPASLVGIPIIPAPPTSNFAPSDSWPGQIDSLPYPLSEPTSRLRQYSIASSATQTNAQGPSSPPYPVTPDNYHLNGYNNQNNIQRNAIRNAIRHEILHGHRRMAGPTPPTFRSMYPEAQHWNDDNLPGQRYSSPHDQMPSTTSRISMPGGWERVSGVNARGALLRTRIALGGRGGRIEQDLEGLSSSRAFGDDFMDSFMDYSIDDHEYEVEREQRQGDRSGRTEFSEIHVQGPTMSTSVRVSHSGTMSEGMRTNGERSRASGYIPRSNHDTPSNSLGPGQLAVSETDRIERKQRHKHHSKDKNANNTRHRNNSGGSGWVHHKKKK